MRRVQPLRAATSSLRQFWRVAEFGGVALERVVQCPHPAAAQIEVKEEVELAGGGFVSPYRCRRFLGPLGRGAQQPGCRRLVQPDQVLCLHGSGDRGAGGALCGFWFNHRQGLIAGLGGRAFGRRGRGGLAGGTRNGVLRRRHFRRGWLRRLNRCRLRGRRGRLPGARRQDGRSQTQQGGTKRRAPPPRLCHPGHDPLRTRLNVHNRDTAPVSGAPDGRWHQCHRRGRSPRAGDHSTGHRFDRPGRSRASLPDR